MIYCNLPQILSRIIFTEAFHLAQVISQAQIDMFCRNFSCSMHASSPLSLLVVSSRCCPGGGGGGGARGTKPCVVKFQNLQFGVRQGSWEWGEPAEFDHPVCLCMYVIILYWMLNLGWSKSHVLSRKNGLWKVFIFLNLSFWSGANSVVSMRGRRLCCHVVLFLCWCIHNWSRRTQNLIWRWDWKSIQRAAKCCLILSSCSHLCTVLQVMVWCSVSTWRFKIPFPSDHCNLQLWSSFHVSIASEICEHSTVQILKFCGLQLHTWSAIFATSQSLRFIFMLLVSSWCFFHIQPLAASPVLSIPLA